MNDEQMSNAEIGRHLGRIEESLKTGFAEIKSDLDKYVLKSVHEAEMRGVDARIGDVEKDLSEAETRQRWAIGFAVTSLLGLVSVAAAVWNVIT